MHECNQFTCVLQQTCMYYTFGCELKNRALDKKWKCHYKDTCVICRLNKSCRKVEKVKKEKEKKHGQSNEMLEKEKR